MNNYLVPMWSRKNHQMKNHLGLIKAENRYQAMLIAIESHDYPEKNGEIVANDLSNTDWHVDQNYEAYKKCENPDEIFTYMNRCGKIKPSINEEENNHMAFFNVNWNDYTQELSSLAIKENWSNDTYPDNKILTNYMVHTYRKLSSEKNIVINKEKEYALFNTGLFNEFYQPIYAYHDEKELQFLTDYELGNMKISDRPPRANYFEDPSLLLFDWHYQININYKHILKDINNLSRIPEKLQDSKNILNNLNGSIETMKKKVSANYKLAIPQYYEGKIQLLLPLCLEDDDIPDLALAVTKVGDYYQGHTCLTLDMAYNNARLIAKPENNWLAETI